MGTIPSTRTSAPAAACLAGLLAILMAPASATAQENEFSKADWPLPVIERPLTLAGGMLEVRGDTFLLNLSSGAVGEPTALAPDIYYGINALLTVGVVHERGICIGGCGEGGTYQDVGVDARYALMRGGNLQAAVHGGLMVRDVSEMSAGLHAGLELRVRAKRFAVVIDPTVYIGVLDRDPYGDELDLPVYLQIQPNQQSMFYLMSGLANARFDAMDVAPIPLALGSVFAVNNRFDIGGELGFSDLFGGAETSGADGRYLIARAALRL